jgi:lathosterol oxidase
MDVTLEIFDTFLLDHVYSALLPASSRNAAEWQYTPATVYFTLEPGEAAFASTWPRDNIYRQGISLFLITWFV